MTRIRLVAAAWIALTATAPVGSQTPTPEQAKTILQSRPDLALQVRQRLMTSGMSAEQVRARLRAEGYPENFLDGYLSAGAGTTGAVNGDVISALQRLGITDDQDARLMRTMLRSDSTGAVGERPPPPAVIRDDVPWASDPDSTSFRVFGLEVFRSITSEFVPVLDGPVDENYALGPGDEIVLILTGGVELAHDLEVTREGFIVVPQVGQISVANLTLGQLREVLYTRLARSYSGIRRGADAPTKFSVSVSRLRAIQVMVVGEVVRPSSYRISSASTAMTALYAAGGPTDQGTLRSVTVRRGGKLIATVDIYDYLLRGDNSADVRLQNGDIVFVGMHGARARMSGEVQRPGTYEFKPGQTIRDAIAAAGGLRATAVTHRLRIARLVPAAERTSSGRARVVLDVPGISVADDAPALEIRAGDEVLVFPVADRVRNRIRVSGHVWTQGTQGFRPGMMLSDALRAAGGLKSDAYLGQVSVTRLRPDSTRQQLRAILSDTTGAVVNDIPLADDDEITVYSMTTFRPDRFVAIGGSVRNGGRFPWREGLTLRDLTLAAGGLREDAYLKEAEIARLTDARRPGISATTIRVALDSSYVGDYVPGRPYAAVAGNAAPSYGSAPETVLSPYDYVLIMQRPDWQPPRSVVLSGEVTFPGRYALRSKSERMSDIIARAGGVTDEASIDAAYFARAAALTSFRADSAGASELRAANGEAGIVAATDPRSITRSRVGVDLAQVLRRPKSDEDLILFDEDSLHLPFRRATVEITGAVNSPTALTAERGFVLSDYVRAAGGASIAGDARRAFVVQPNGKIETRRTVLGILRIQPRPRPGSTVVVPAKSTTDRTSERVALVSVIAQTIASLATVYVILTR